MSSLSTSSTPPAGDDSTPESQPVATAATEPTPVAVAQTVVTNDAQVPVDGAPVDAAPVDAAEAVDSNDAVAAAPTEQAQRPAPGAPQEDCGPQLKQLYPALFSSNPPKPLKLRIQADIQARSPGVFTKPQLSAFLRRYTGSHGYLNAMVKATHRFDLDGNPGDALSDEHRQAAVDELARRRANTQARRALEDEQRANRATLLREYSVNTLPAAEFAASKGIAEAELEPLIERARKEAAEPPALNRDRRGPPQRRERGERGERGDRNDRGERGNQAAQPPRAPHALQAQATPQAPGMPRPDGPRAPRAEGQRSDGPRGPQAQRGPQVPRDAQAPRADAPRGPRPENGRGGPRPEGARPDHQRGYNNAGGHNGMRNEGARGPRAEDPRGARPAGPRPSRPDVIANPAVPTAMAAAFAALRSVSGTPAATPAAKTPAKSK